MRQPAAAGGQVLAGAGALSADVPGSVLMGAPWGTLLGVLSAMLGLAGDAAATAGERPPAGRYRCYQPPSYMVTAWFDLEADGTYRLQGDPPARYAFDPATRVLRWLDGGQAGSGQVGLYVPPAAKGGQPATGQATAERHAIVMTSPKNLRPPKNDRDPRVQCLLTTH